MLLQRERFGFFNLPIENSLHRPPKAYFQLSTERSTHSLTALHRKHPGLRAEERKGQTRNEGEVVQSVEKELRGWNGLNVTGNKNSDLREDVPNQMQDLRVGQHPSSVAQDLTEKRFPI